MKQLIYLFIFGLFFTACQGDSQQKTATTTPKPAVKKIPIPRFDRELAYNFVAKQVEFGPRVPNTEAHTATKNWLVSQLKEHGATVIEQDFKATAYTGTVFNSTNIIGQYNPAAKKRIVLAAHWDSRFIADNDADGTLPAEMGVDIVFFDAEDNGISGGTKPEDSYTWALGSQYWAKNLHASGYKPKYGILLDMVGAKSPRFRKEGYSMANAPNIVNKVWKLAAEMGHGNYFTDEKGGAITDDHRMVMEFAKFPMIDIINMPHDSDPVFVKHWHTTNDNMDNINKRTLGAVGQVMLAVVFNEAMGRF